MRSVALAGVLALLLPVALAGAATTAPNDPLWRVQWNLTRVGAPSAWGVSTGKGITIGVVDTGVDLPHEDLAAHILASTNCVGSGGDATQCRATGQDDNGHGTHVAGIAAAITNNGKGIAGMAPEVKLLVAKAVDSSGSGATTDIAAGIHWVVDRGAKVVNLSLGNPGIAITSLLASSIQNAIEYAWSKGAVPVLAAGNSNILGFGSSNYGNIDAVVVGATGRDGAVTGYSAPTGTAKWALLAPGGSQDGTAADDIMSTYWVSGQANSYRAMSGTDMAAPLVSGTLALMLAAGLTPATAVNKLLSTVNQSVSCGNGSTNCHGELNAAAALASATSTSTTLPPHTPTTVGSPASSTIPPTVVPPAVMSPTHKGSTTPSHSGQTQTAPPGNTTLKDSRAVAVAPFSAHHNGSSLVWFVALAGVFVLAGGAGLYWVIRMHPDPD